MEGLKLTGYFRGCFCGSKWGKARKEQNWTLLCKTVPAICKRFKELPNSVRRILNMSHLKNEWGYTQKADSVHIPYPLQVCIEDMVMERIVLGEEVTMQFVANTMSFAIDLWNESVGTMQNLFYEKSLEMLQQQDANFANLSEDALVMMDQAGAHISKTYRKLQMQWHNKLVWLAWHQRGYTSQLDIARWLFDGNQQSVIAQLQRSRDSMTRLCHLTELPEFAGEEDGEMEHMRMHQIDGETSYQWAIQLNEDVSSRRLLPEYVGKILGMRVCKFAQEHASWEGAIRKRAEMGKPLTNTQQVRHTVFLASAQEKLIFCKRRKRLICDAKQVNKECFALELNLSDDATKLTLAPVRGTAHRLVLLKAGTMDAAALIPSELDRPVPGDIVPDDQSDGDVENEGEPLGEDQIRDYADQMHQFNNPADAIEEEAGVDVLADSDDDLEALGLSHV
ncbi:unnamed protein product [Effrenium voratum]|uniref:Uncharacterized protein n=1 Tax=Effrenium voratum TaxID=2562239 RepID=A0AA36MSN5_9DINO|nr:unnamed protein product [Effrenium voratum]